MDIGLVFSSFVITIGVIIVMLLLFFLCYLVIQFMIWLNDKGKHTVDIFCGAVFFLAIWLAVYFAITQPK